MIKCDPVRMRENLEVVEEYKIAGVDFVAIAVVDEAHRIALRKLACDSIDAILKDIT